MICTRAECLVSLGRESSATASELALIDMLLPLIHGVVGDYLRKNAEYKQHVEILPMGKATAGRDDVALDDAEFRFTDTTVTIHGRTFAGTSILQLTHTPVALAGLEVRENIGGHGGQSSDPFGDDTILTIGDDYYLDVDGDGTLSHTGHLHRLGSWPTEPRSIKVTYFGGHTAAKLNNESGSIKLATILTMVKAFHQLRAFQSHEAGPKTSESIGKYSYTRGLNQVYAGGGFTIPYEAQCLLSNHRSFSRIFG